LKGGKIIADRRRELSKRNDGKSQKIGAKRTSDANFADGKEMQGNSKGGSSLQEECEKKGKSSIQGGP